MDKDFKCQMKDIMLNWPTWPTLVRVFQVLECIELNMIDENDYS